MFSKFSFVEILVLTLAGSSFGASNLHLGNACIARYLESRNKLEVGFPIPSEIDLSSCRVVMPIIMNSFETVLCKKLSEKESINAGCVVDMLKKEGALEYMLKQELILMSKDLNEGESKVKLEDVKEKLRSIFKESAEACNSDPTYAGLFDDILQIKNESLAVLRQDYCFTKFVIESKLIDVKDIDFNPKKIITSDIDCKTMIKNNRVEREKKLMESLKLRNLSKEQLQCIMDKFQIERAFDSNLALEVIDHIDVSLDVRRTNRARIAEKLENFVKSIFLCTGKTADKNQSTIMKY